MIDKLEIQSGLAKRILNTLPYLHTPEAIAQELDKTEVMRNILQTSERTDTITKIKVKLMQVKDIRGTANRVTELQVLDDIELFELKAFSLLVVEMRELLLSANITVVSLPDLEPVVNILDPEKMRIPHFYTPYYVYQYSTGYSAAVAFSKMIIEDGKPAVDKYINNFLCGGCSKDPIDLLKSAGVDMSTPKPVDDALNVFEDYLKKLEATV